MFFDGYHADNGRYAEQVFRDDCKQKSQTLRYYGVGAYHQNGITDAKIKQLTLASRTMMLLHAQHHWPEYITTMPWFFALMAAADRINNLDVDHGRAGHTTTDIFERPKLIL